MRVVPFTLALLVSFGIDQLSKWFVLHWLGLTDYGKFEIVPRILSFQMGWNHGINFGLFADSLHGVVWPMIALSLIIPFGLVLWARGALFHPLHWVSLGLLSGGALANGLDRFRYGAVADFLNISFWVVENPYIFNLADCFIFFGLLGIVFVKNPQNPHARPQPSSLPKNHE